MEILAPQLPLHALAGTTPLSLRGGAVGTPEELDARATKAANEFEAFFITSMMDSMTAGMKADKMFGGGAGEDMFRSMLNQEYGKEIAKGGSLGVAKLVKSSILKLQEQAAS